MARQASKSVTALALVLVALMLGMCLRAAAEVSAPGHHSCAALTGDQVRLSKAASPSLWAVPGERAIPQGGLPLSTGAPPDLTKVLLLVAFWGDRACRAPPALL